MSSKFSYTLTLKVNDFGSREFSSSREPESSRNMANCLANDIARALQLLNDPPGPADLAHAMRDGGSAVLEAVAALHCGPWTGSNDFDEAFSVAVDVGVLTEEGDEDDRLRAVVVCQRAGFAIRARTKEQVDEPK